MKIGSLACLGAAALVMSLSADVTAPNTFGVMKVTCDAKKVIIATPWVSCENIDAAVKVTNLVMTANLAENDAVIVYDNGQFKAWQLDSSLVWQPVAVTDIEATSVAGDASSEAITRGNGFWFVKSDYTSGTYDLYLYGQSTAASATSTVVANAYNLLANPNTASATPTFGFTPNASDQIQIPSGVANYPPVTYTYKGASGWGTEVPTPKEINARGGGKTMVTQMVWTAGCSIPAGRGFWYISKGGSGTITW